MKHDQHQEIQDGSLCDAYIGQFPDYVKTAANSVTGAEALFQRARAFFESESGSTMMTLRIHGISPKNKPLGFRDYQVDYPDLLTLGWIDEVRQMWPFQSGSANCCFVPRGGVRLPDDGSAPVLHFILSFVTGLPGVPVLVRQCIHSAQGSRDQREMWAVVIPSEANDITIHTELNRFPFWFHPQTRTHCYREGDLIQERDWDWRPGDVLDLKLNVHSPEHILIAVLEMEVRRQAQSELEEESVSFLQIGANARTSSDHDEISQPDDPFMEICHECCQLFEAAINPTQDEGGVTVKSVAQPDPGRPSDDNVNLLSARIITAHQQDQEDGSRNSVHDVNSARANVVQISLELTVASTPIPCNDTVPMFQIFEAESLKQEFCHPWDGELSWLPEGMRIHAATWEALHQQSPHDWGQVVEVELFVDGATHGDEAGWAVVVITKCPWGQCCQGMIAGVVATHPEDPHYLGASRSTNITAEGTALIVAQAYAAAIPVGPIVRIRPDLRLNKQIADLQLLLKKDKGLAALSACLSRMASCSIELEEVRAHQHHPWNELADQVAKHAARTAGSYGYVPWERLSRLAKEEQERDWLWLQTADAPMQNVFPPLIENMALRVDETTTDPQPVVCSPPSLPDTATCDLKACTINVLALDETEAKLHGTRALRLDKQLHELGVSFACLQEARTVQGQRITDHFSVFSSGGTGHLNKQYSLGQQMQANHDHCAR